MSLCAAMVLLGVPRGQNFVAEAAEEATKSVALLTLTLTGDAEEPLEAKMEWKSFVQGTTVGLEVVFVDEEGNASEPRDFGTWLDTYGSMESDDAGFTTFAPAEWLVGLFGPSGKGSGSISSAFGFDYYPDVASAFRPFLSTVDWFWPLPLTFPGAGVSGAADFFGLAGSPGLASVARGSSLSVPPHPLVALYESAALEGGVALSASFAGVVADPSVVSFDSASASIVGVGVGATTLSLSCSLTFTAPDEESEVLGPVALGTLAVEVYDPSPVTEASAGPAYLESTVDVNGRQQRLRVYNPNNVLPADTTFTAEYVDGTHGDHNFFITHTGPTSDVELRHYYNLTLASGGQTLSQLDGPVELWFEAIDGIDAPDAFISRVAEGADAILSPTLYTDEGGVTWIKVLTDHFSPYALTDLLSADEKAALTQENSGPKNNVKTGDLPTQITVAGLGMTLVLALGIMLRLITNKRKFEE